MGIDQDYAPVVDVDTNPLNPVIGDRSLGEIVAGRKPGREHDDETILFWHTGGSAALFAYAEELMGEKA